MTWLTFTLIAAGLAAVERISHRYLLTDYGDPTAYSIVYQLAAACFLAPVAAMEAKSYEPSPTDWPLYAAILASGGFWMAYNTLTFHADRNTDVSVTSVLSRTRAVWTVLLGALLFSESITGLRLAGAVLIVLGAAALARPSTIRATRGVTYALMAAIAISIGLALDNYAVSGLPVGVVAMASFLIGGLLLAALTPGRTKRVRQVITGRARYSIIVALLSAGSSWSLKTGLSLGDVGQVVPIYQAYLIIVVLAGIVLLRERSDLVRKLAAAATVIVGAVLVNMG